MLASLWHAAGCVLRRRALSVTAVDMQFFHEAILSDWDCIYKLVPDEQDVIEEAIKDLVRFRCDCAGCEVLSQKQCLVIVPQYHSVCVKLLTCPKQRPKIYTCAMDDKDVLLDECFVLVCVSLCEPDLYQIFRLLVVSCSTVAHAG